MAVWSKLPHEVQFLSCRSLAHPSTQGCLKAAVFAFLDSFIGSTIFFLLLNFGQYVSTLLKKKRKVSFKDFLVKQLRSTLIGASVSTGAFATHCLLRNLLGKYYFYTMVFIPASIAGFAGFFEDRKGRELYVNAFANCALEFFIRRLEFKKILKWTLNTQTFTFMLISSTLSSLFNLTKFDLNYFWFFLPPKATNKQENGICFHKEDCKKQIFNLFVMYSTTGLVVQVLRLFIGNLKSPKLFLKSLMKPKTYNLAIFLSSYALIYQAIRCFFYQREKKYSVKHDAIAGFLAGAAFRFQPTLPILNSAVITTIQILWESAFRRRMVPNIPYAEIIFALLCGLMFHARIYYPEQCPQLMVHIMSTITNGRSDNCARTYETIFKKLNLPMIS